jgi:Na+-transporting methylmalonyl-CoA/oxaloacetate decarboxylase gamma subunit
LPVDLLVGKSLGPDLPLGLMVVHKHDTDQEVHEEEGADEDEEDCEYEVEDLAVVLDGSLHHHKTTVSEESMKV